MIRTQNVDCLILCRAAKSAKEFLVEFFERGYVIWRAEVEILPV